MKYSNAFTALVLWSGNLFSDHGAFAASIVPSNSIADHADHASVDHILHEGEEKTQLRKLSSSDDNESSTKSMGSKSGKSGKSKSTSARCTREVYSIEQQNSAWKNFYLYEHEYYPKVWYHTLEDIHNMWKEDYFDYLLDVRPLLAWEIYHIPGSYPTYVSGYHGAENGEILVDFPSSTFCKDARIFVHSHSGNHGNLFANDLIKLGFTNVHAAGPAGYAGTFHWNQAGYEITVNDTFDADSPRFQAACIDTCNTLI